MTITDHDALHHQLLKSTAYQIAYSLVPSLDALQCVYLLSSLSLTCSAPRCWRHP